MNLDLSAAAALGAGLLSFFSPCTLPLIPSYLSFLGASSLSLSQDERPRRLPVIVGTLFFILGFTLAFVILGAGVYGSLALMGGFGLILNRIAGGVAIILGLNMLFDFIPLLNYEKRFQLKKPRRDKSPSGIGPIFLIDALLFGAAFGAGWTPCIGPILSGVIALAGMSGSLGRAVLYLALYSCGLGLPFLFAAVFIGVSLKILGKAKRRLPLLRRISALTVIIIGLCIAFGRLNALNSALAQGGWRLQRWSQTGSLQAKIIPAGILGMVGLGFTLLGIPRRMRRSASPGMGAQRAYVPVIAGGLCLLGAALHGAGIVNWGLVISKWLLFQGA